MRARMREGAELMRHGPRRDLYGVIVNASLEGKAARDIAAELGVGRDYVSLCRNRAKRRGFVFPRDPYSKGGGVGSDANEGNAAWKALGR